MKSIITTIVLFFGVVWFSGCQKAPAIQPNGHLSHKDSWPPKEKPQENIDLSDIDKSVQERAVSAKAKAEDTKVLSRIAFPAHEYQRLATTGTNTIRGSVYLENNHGRRIFGAGTRLYLNPVTSYSRQWHKESYLRGRVMSPADDRLFNYLKFTSSDTNGNFVFYGVPDGSYYAVGTVVCGNECGFQGIKNVRIATEVSVAGGQVANVNLSKRL